MMGVEFGVLNDECGMWSVECRMDNVEWGIRGVERLFFIHF